MMIIFHVEQFIFLVAWWIHIVYILDSGSCSMFLQKFKKGLCILKHLVVFTGNFDFLVWAMKRVRVRALFMGRTMQAGIVEVRVVLRMVIVRLVEM